PAPVRSTFFAQSSPRNRRDRGSTNSLPTTSQNKNPTYADDSTIVRDSQAQALEQAEGASGDSRDPRSQALWSAAIKEMEKALARLDMATTPPVPLPDALAAEQAAYQALLK